MSVDFRIFAASLFVKANRERMIHFKPKVTNTWGKSFLTSVMGTTISILLTFGTSLRKSLERVRRDTFPVTTNKAHDKIEIVVSRDKNGDVNSHYLKRVKEK